MAIDPKNLPGGKPDSNDKINYSETRVLKGKETVREFENTLKELDEGVDKLHHQYDLFFNGSRRRPPWEERIALDRLARKLRRMNVKRTIDSFRLASVVSKYVMRLELWNKSMKLAEEGQKLPGWSQVRRTDLVPEQHTTIPPEKKKPAEPRAKGVASSAATLGGKNGGGETERLFNMYVAARKKTGQDVSKLNIDKFAGMLDKQTKSLVSKNKCKSVSYRVEIREGKVALKAKPVR